MEQEIKCGKCLSSYKAPWYMNVAHREPQYHCPVCYKGNVMNTEDVKKQNIYKYLLKD